MAKEQMNVTSSNISAIGYDSNTQTLSVTFHNGDTWEYSRIFRETWEDFKAAESKGRFFHQWIKGRYTEEKV